MSNYFARSAYVFIQIEHYVNIHYPLEDLVGRGSETKLQVGNKLNYII